MTVSVRYFVLVVFMLFSLTLSGQKIFPGAVGYGTSSRGAYEGSDTPEILIVDNLKAGVHHSGDNRGSFEWAISQNYPRIIIFEVGGIIDYTSTDTRSIYIEHPYCNIYGQTAPSPGITIKSSSIIVGNQAHDILLQHIAIRYGAHPKPDGTVSPQDCLTLLKGTRDIVVDHCSFSWSVDEIIGAYSKNLTISNTLLYEGLQYNYHANEGGNHEPERHGYGPIASTQENFTSYNNLYAWFTNRFPKMASNNIAFINNYTTGHGTFGPDVAHVSAGNNAAFIGNNWYPTPGMSHVDDAQYFMRWRGSLNLNSTFYMKDNNCLRRDNGFAEAENVLTDMGKTAFNTVYTDNPEDNVIDLSGYNVKPADDVLSYIIENSGFRPWDRDFYDSIAIEKLIEGKQDFINSPYALPARAYNRSVYEGLKSSAGNMANGYNFSNNNVSFSVNGKSIKLTQNTSSQKEVIDILNAQLPSGIEAVDHPHRLCEHIIIQTTNTGSNQSITISGNASVFGIPNGTYKGEDASYRHVTYPSTNHALNVPANPHGDANNNDYTNIEEWIADFSSESGYKKNTKILPENDSTIKININAQVNLPEWNELESTNYRLDNLTFESGKTSTYGFEIWQDWRSSNGGDISGNCYPSGVIKTYLFTDDNVLRSFKWKGLDNSKQYDIEFLCSRSSAAPDERGSFFTIGNEKDSINAKGNTCDLVKFGNLRPSNGTITIDYRKRISDFNGHVNAIIITEKKVSGETVEIPDNTGKIENTRPVVALDYEESVKSGTVKTIDASTSFDPDNDNLHFQWIFPEDISTTNANKPSISYLVPDVYYPHVKSMILQVSDGKDTTYKSFDITFTPYEPEAPKAGVTAVEASHFDGNNHPNNILDGNPNTYWSAKGDNHWLTVELSTPVNISHLKVAYYQMEDKKSKFEILVSNDKYTWEPLAEEFKSCGFSSEMHLVQCNSFSNTTGYKFIKFIGHGTNVDDVNVLSVLDVYGEIVSETSSIDFEKSSSFSVYPNPATDYLNIDLSIQSIVKLIDINGRIVYQEMLQVGSNRIPLEFQKGYYILTVESDNQQNFKEKIIIN